VRVCVYTCACIYVCARTRARACVRASEYVCARVCMYVCMYVCQVKSSQVKILFPDGTLNKQCICFFFPSSQYVCMYVCMCTYARACEVVCVCVCVCCCTSSSSSSSSAAAAAAAAALYTHIKNHGRVRVFQNCRMQRAVVCRVYRGRDSSVVRALAFPSQG